MTPRSGDRVWLGVIAALMVVAVGVLWRAGGDRPVSGGGFIRDRGDVGTDSPSQQTQAAVAATELALRLYPEPTQTPDVRIVTATPTETPVPEQLPICEQAALGEVCLRTAGLVTATPTVGAPWCSELTPSAFGYPQKCRSSAVSTARDEVK